MRERHLSIKHRRRFVRTTDSDHDNPVFPDLYRNQIATSLDKEPISLISCLPPALLILQRFSMHAVAGSSAMPLAGILIPSWRWQRSMRRSRIADQSEAPAFIIATAAARYASAGYREALSRYGLTGSMSAVGKPYDNAQAESFMKTLKVEEIYLSGYEAFADVTSRLPRFLEYVYNARRMQSPLGHLSPKQFEGRLAQQAA